MASLKTRFVIDNKHASEVTPEHIKQMRLHVQNIRDEARRAKQLVNTAYILMQVNIDIKNMVHEIADLDLKAAELMAKNLDLGEKLLTIHTQKTTLEKQLKKIMEIKE